MGRLSEEAERAVIHDWLTIDGRAKGNTEPWIQAMAKEAHGWPQHFIAFTQPAVEFLTENGGEMTDEGLKETLARGRFAKEKYYNDRTAGLMNVDIINIAKATKSIPPGGAMAEDLLLRRLAGRSTRKDPRRLLNHLIHKGVIAERGQGECAIPIPSLKNWLVESGRGFHRAALDAWAQRSWGGE